MSITRRIFTLFREFIEDGWKMFFDPMPDNSEHALGRWIIIYACVLHIVWAILLCIDHRAGNATAVAILLELSGGSYLMTVALLFFVAFLAGGFLDVRLRRKVSLETLSLLLLPQQIILWCSAGSGIYATCVGHYADGVIRAWSHILADQSPVILTAFLYTVVLLETHIPPNPAEARLIKGEQGAQGATGPTGPTGQSS